CCSACRRRSRSRREPRSSSCSTTASSSSRWPPSSSPPPHTSSLVRPRRPRQRSSWHTPRSVAERGARGTGPIGTGPIGTGPIGTGPISLRHNRDFVLLQAGQLLSTFGSSVSGIAYPLLVLALTGSAAKAGYVGAAELAPMLLLSLVAGLAADRFDRKRMMIAADVVSAAAVGALAAAVLTHHVSFWLIMVVALVDSSAGVCFRAAQSGAFRAVVPVAQLPAAASFLQARAATVRLGGPPVGGALFAAGRALPFVADAISYAFSTVSLLLMRTRFQEAREREPVPLRTQLAEGLSFFSHVAFLRTTLLLIAGS